MSSLDTIFLHPHMLTRVAGGAAAGAGVKRLIDQTAWQAMVQSVENAVVENVGRGGA